MPIYTYQCSECSNVKEAYRHISERHNSPHCCNIKTTICIMPAMVQPDLPGYESPITGVWVEGRKARREDLKKHRCIPYEEGMKQDAIREQKRIKDMDSQRAIVAASEAYYSLSLKKQRILNEAKYG